MKFPLYAILSAALLFGIGYYPSVNYDSAEGPTGLACGLGLVLLLIVPSYFVMRWALGQSHKVFMISFGAGFLIRLVILVVLFILYAKLVARGTISFAAGFGVGYLALLFLEIFSFRSAFARKKEP